MYHLPRTYLRRNAMDATTDGRGGLESINDRVREYLRDQQSGHVRDGWTIGCSDHDDDDDDNDDAPSVVAGRGIVATRDHGVGEVIFVDVPLIVSPRAVQRRQPQQGPAAVCPVCYGPPATAAGCPAGCRLPVCGRRCADAPGHLNECRYVRGLGPGPGPDDGWWSAGVYNAIAPVRGLLTLKDGPYRCFLDMLQKKATDKPMFEVRARRRYQNYTFLFQTPQFKKNK